MDNKHRQNTLKNRQETTNILVSMIFKGRGGLVKNVAY
jgi:hypothetical protein